MAKTKSGAKRSKKPTAAERAANRAAADKTSKKNDEHVERNGAHAYSERTPIIAEELAERGGSATVQELYKALKTKATGLFATPRRVAATVRYEKRTAEANDTTPPFALDGGSVVLAKRVRSKSKSKSKRVSRKRTRASK